MTFLGQIRSGTIWSDPAKKFGSWSVRNTVENINLACCLRVAVKRVPVPLMVFLIFLDPTRTGSESSWPVARALSAPTWWTSSWWTGMRWEREKVNVLNRERSSTWVERVQGHEVREIGQFHEVREIEVKVMSRERSRAWVERGQGHELREVKGMRWEW